MATKTHDATLLTDAQVVTGDGVICRSKDRKNDQIKFELCKEWVFADFARQLERELAALRAKLTAAEAGLPSKPIAIEAYLSQDDNELRETPEKIKCILTNDYNTLRAVAVALKAERDELMIKLVPASVVITELQKRADEAERVLAFYAWLFNR